MDELPVQSITAVNSRKKSRSCTIFLPYLAKAQDFERRKSANNNDTMNDRHANQSMIHRVLRTDFCTRTYRMWERLCWSSSKQLKQRRMKVPKIVYGKTTEVGERIDPHLLPNAVQAHCPPSWQFRWDTSHTLNMEWGTVLEPVVKIQSSRQTKVGLFSPWRVEY